LQRCEKDFFELSDFLRRDRKFINECAFEEFLVRKILAAIVRVDLGDFRRCENGLPKGLNIIASFLRTDTRKGIS
jgi:hypothetical protein